MTYFDRLIECDEVLSDEFIFENFDEFDLLHLFQYLKKHSRLISMREEFVYHLKSHKECTDYIVSQTFSRQEIAEDFVREFSQSVLWRNLSQDANLSKDFVLEFLGEICWKQLLLNPNISYNTKIYFDDILQSGEPLPDNFIKNNIYMFDLVNLYEYAKKNKIKSKIKKYLFRLAKIIDWKCCFQKNKSIISGDFIRYFRHCIDKNEVYQFNPNCYRDYIYKPFCRDRCDEPEGDTEDDLKFLMELSLL